METRVAQVLATKGGSGVVSIGPEATVFEAISRMVAHNVGSILVCRGEEVLGIFTERDYLKKIALEGRTSRETLISEVMTAGVRCIDPSWTIPDCMRLMTELKCRHLPVLDDGRISGLISIGDCVKAVSESHARRASHLTEFVTGTYPA